MTDCARDALDAFTAHRENVIDATAAFECARAGHEPMLRMTSIFVASWFSTCNRCGRVVEFKNREPIRV